MSVPHFSVDNRKEYVPRSSLSGLLIMWLKILLMGTLSLWISNVKGSDPLNGEHAIAINNTAAKFITVTSCPHVNDIKLVNNKGGLIAGDICGSPIMI